MGWKWLAMKWIVKEGQSRFALTFQMAREGFLFAVEDGELEKIATDKWSAFAGSRYAPGKKHTLRLPEVPPASYHFVVHDRDQTPQTILQPGSVLNWEERLVCPQCQGSGGRTETSRRWETVLDPAGIHQGVVPSGIAGHTTVERQSETWIPCEKCGGVKSIILLQGMRYG